MSPRSDLCDTCQHFRDGLHYNARQEEEAKDLLKRFKEHLSKAKVERNYYNKNTKLAEEQRKLVNQNYSKGKTQYCSIDAEHLLLHYEIYKRLIGFFFKLLNLYIHLKNGKGLQIPFNKLFIKYNDCCWYLFYLHK